MTVKELIKELETLPQNSDVYVRARTYTCPLNACDLGVVDSEFYCQLDEDSEDLKRIII